MNTCKLVKINSCSEPQMNYMLDFQLKVKLGLVAGAIYSRQLLVQGIQALVKFGLCSGDRCSVGHPECWPLEWSLSKSLRKTLLLQFVDTI